MIWTRSAGRSDGPLLVMLHGLGGTAEVWRGVEALVPSVWPGGWLSVDLPGHGRSPWAPSYTFEAHGAAVVEALPRDRDLVMLGHSLGGMIALAMAGHHERINRVIGFSIKTYWPPAHIEGMQKQAAREPRVFETKGQAVDLYLRLSGLTGLVDADDPHHDAGVAEVEGGWRVAQDPRTFDFGVPNMPALLAGTTARVTLGRGSEDHLVRDANVELVPDAVTFDGLGHNPHVEQPGAIVRLLAE